MHLSLDMSTAIPRSYPAFYPALYSQASLQETINILFAEAAATMKTVDAGHPSSYEQREKRRENYKTR